VAEKRVRGRKRRKLVEKVRRLIGKNYTDGEVCDQLDIRPDSLTAIKSEILNFDQVSFEHMESGAVLSDYVMKARQNITDLNHLIKATNIRRAPGSEKAAYVAAIKLRSEIQDKVVRLGQDLGFIDRKAQETKNTTTLEGGINLSIGKMSDEEIKAEIKAEVAQMNKIVSGKVITMRPELLGVTDSDVKKFLPANVIDVEAKVIKKKKKARVNKVKLNK